jgi:hypothetical protein
VLKVKRAKGTHRCFSKVSKSRHSPLILVGAPMQGCGSALIRARIKCSLQADSLTLCCGESPTTAHKLTWVIHKLRRIIIKLSITTQPSRWWSSQRVTSTKYNLTKDKPNEKGRCTLATSYTLIGSLILDYQTSISPLGSYSPLHTKVSPQLNKLARELNWTSRSIYTPHCKAYLLGSNWALIGCVRSVANGYMTPALTDDR